MLVRPFIEALTTLTVNLELVTIDRMLVHYGVLELVLLLGGSAYLMENILRKINF